MNTQLIFLIIITITTLIISYQDIRYREIGIDFIFVNLLCLGMYLYNLMPSFMWFIPILIFAITPFLPLREHPITDIIYLILTALFVIYFRDIRMICIGVIIITLLPFFIKRQDKIPLIFNLSFGITISLIYAYLLKI